MSSDHLFNRYAANWQQIKSHPNVHIEPDEDDVFICPLCIKCFPREAIKEKVITKEHIPAKKLGGRVRTLTCTVCNSWAGAHLDSNLIKTHQAIDFFNNIPNSSISVTYRINGIGSLPATFFYSSNEVFNLIGDPKRSNRKILDQVKRTKFSGEPGSMKFNIRFELNKLRHKDAALLRIGYLWMFSVFGYAFLLNPSLSVIRGQMFYPDDDILPAWGAFRHNFPDEYLGINLITKPSALRSFLVIFDVITSNKVSTRYGVMMPGPSKPGLSIYSKLSELKSIPLTYSISHIPESDVDFIKEPFAIFDYWYSQS